MTRETEQREEHLTDLGAATTETKGQGGAQLSDADTGQRYNIVGLRVGFETHADRAKRRSMSMAAAA